jgi:hypothetical protein
MAAERKAGSNLGRPAIDWQQAFQCYASLPSDQRSYGTVAARFKVSVRTVERHGLQERWKERAHQIDREAAAAAAAQLAADRARKLADLEKPIDASEVKYAQNLRSGAVRISPADLPRLHKLRKDIWEDLEAEPLEPTTAPTPNENADSTERKLQVLRALRDAGALQRLHDLVDEPTHASREHHDEDNDAGTAAFATGTASEIAEPTETDG